MFWTVSEIVGKAIPNQNLFNNIFMKLNSAIQKKIFLNQTLTEQSKNYQSYMSVLKMLIEKY